MTPHQQLIASASATDNLVRERDELVRELVVLKDMLIEVRRLLPPSSGARGQQLTAWDSFEAYLRTLPRLPSYEVTP